MREKNLLAFWSLERYNIFSVFKTCRYQEQYLPFLTLCSLQKYTHRAPKLNNHKQTNDKRFTTSQMSYINWSYICSWPSATKINGVSLCANMYDSQRHWAFISMPFTTTKRVKRGLHKILGNANKAEKQHETLFSHSSTIPEWMLELSHDTAPASFPFSVLLPWQYNPQALQGGQKIKRTS